MDGGISPDLPQILCRLMYEPQILPQSPTLAYLTSWTMTRCNSGKRHRRPAGRNYQIGGLLSRITFLLLVLQG